jgi:BatD DUF11 like domain
MQRFLIALLIGFGFETAALADPTVQASLSDTTTEIDRPVRLKIEIRDVRGASPPDLSADGLAINYIGQSTRMQTLNFQTSIVTTFDYVVNPMREGTFVIPSVEIQAGGRTYQTDRLPLRVVASAGRAAEQLYFGELVIPKETAYVGEQVPVEIRFYFDRRVWYQPYPQGQFPIIQGDGFVTKKYPEPSAKQQEINGRLYEVLIYRTALTGVKPGKLQLPAAFQQFMVRVPLQRRSMPGDDLLEQLPFSDPFFNSFERREAKITTGGATLEIKPLPASGRPDSFSGAVGQFSLNTVVQPTNGKPGDPITLRIEVKGLGNFDRMDAPRFGAVTGWNVYDPTAQTEILDDVGLSAIKTFQYMLVPQAATKQVPVAEFAYFDPSAEKYVTLRTSAVAVDVEGRAIAEPTSAPAATPSTATPSPTATPVPDVLFIRTEKPNPATFAPIYQQPAFWIAQAVPAGLLLLLGLGTWWNNLQQAAQPLKPLIQQQRALRQQLDSSDAAHAFDAAVRLLQINLLLRQRTVRQTVSLEELSSQKSLPPDLRDEIDRLIQSRNNFVYGHQTSGPISDQQRVWLRSIVRKWETAR